MTAKRGFLPIILICVLVGCNIPVVAMFPINLFKPWDINLRPPKWPNTYFQVTGWGEFGLHADGFNADGHEVPVTQIWTPNQDALAMLKGFGPDSPETDFFVNVLGSPTDDGIRGNFIVNGDLEASTFGFAVRYHAPHNFTVGLHLPFFAMKLKNIHFIDQTQEITASDVVVKDNLTNNLAGVIAQLDPTLDITGWKRMAFGDIALVAEWIRDFYQGRPILKNVELNARMGITIPTGAVVDENKIESIPFGFDGSFSFIGGGGIQINWWNYLRGGIDAEFIHLFGNTRERRIKIEAEQTDLLFLAKARAFKQYGFTQRFNVYLEAFNLLGGGLWFGAAYQYWRHDDDSLSLCTNKFSQEIANTAQNLQGWTINELIFKIGYDFQSVVCDDKGFKPQISAFYKMPIVGTRAIIETTIGGTFSVNF